MHQPPVPAEALRFVTPLTNLLIKIVNPLKNKSSKIVCIQWKIFNSTATFELTLENFHEISTMKRGAES